MKLKDLFHKTPDAVIPGVTIQTGRTKTVPTPKETKSHKRDKSLNTPEFNIKVAKRRKKAKMAKESRKKNRRQ